MNGFPPEEEIICDWLIKELGNAQSWEKIRELMRALANVRRLGEDARAQAKQSAVAPMNPVPVLPVYPRRSTPRVSDPAPEVADGAPWEDDPETM